MVSGDDCHEQDMWNVWSQREGSGVNRFTHRVLGGGGGPSQKMKSPNANALRELSQGQADQGCTFYEFWGQQCHMLDDDSPF